MLARSSGLIHLLRVDSSTALRGVTRHYASQRSIAKLLQSTSADSDVTCEVNLNGFVHSVRKQKRVAFAAVADGSSLQHVQVVMNPTQAEKFVDVSSSGGTKKC